MLYIKPLVPLALVAAAVLAACGGGGNSTVAPVVLGDTVAVTAAGRVISFNRATPATLSSTMPLLGLASGETLIGIDARPADRAIYAVGSTGRIYTLDAASGVLTVRSTLSVALSGTAFGVDFNPVADRLRLVSNTGQNLRVDVTTGAAVVDGAINGASTNITASAYTNSFAGTVSTQLFNLDGNSGNLYLQDPPNNGTQSGAVPLGVTFTASNGFDIDARTNTGYAALVVGGVPRLYTVPLSGTAGAALVGTIGGGEAIVGMTLVPTAAPTAFALLANSTLASFTPTAPNTLSTPVAISGLASGESVLGIDFRPSNGRLYALTSSARLLTVVPETGAATVVATLVADPTDTTAPYVALGGTRFTVDFNPVADRLRVISDNGQNLRINVDTGATTTDGVINRTAPAVVVAGAYTNNFAGSTATDLFDLENNQNVLARQTPPNDGTLVNVGALGVTLGGQGAVDIVGGANGLVLAALRSGTTGPFSLYTLSLTTGAATLYGNTGGNAALSQVGGSTGPVVRDLAIRF